MVGGPRGVRGVHDVRHPLQLLPPVPVHRRGAGPAAVGGDGEGEVECLAAEGQGCSECAGLAAPPPKTSTVLLRGLRRETSSIYRS